MLYITIRKYVYKVNSEKIRLVLLLFVLLLSELNTELLDHLVLAFGLASALRM